MLGMALKRLLVAVPSLVGVVIVMLVSAAVNTPLALSGTLALGLAGQLLFSLAGDKWGFLGLMRRRLGVPLQSSGDGPSDR